MGIFKNFTILAIVIAWNVEPVNAQVENPCPQIQGHEVSFPAVDLDIFEIPNINSQRIGAIPASQTFSLSNLSAKYYDGICWYEVNYSATNEAGWVGFKLDYNDENQGLNESFEPEPMPEVTITPDESSNSLSQIDKSVEDLDEPPDPDPTPVIQTTLSQSTPNNIENKELKNTDAEDSNLSDSDLIVLILVVSVILILILAFIIFVIKTFIKILIGIFKFLLSPFIKNPKNKNNKVKAKTKRKKTHSSSTSTQNTPFSKNPNNDIINVKKIRSVDISHGEVVEKLSFRGSFNDNNPSNQATSPAFVELPENTDRQLENVNDNSTLQPLIFNFNQENRQFFEADSCFYCLKPTDNVIHGLAGNLGINNEAELEIVETSQASYLGFEAEGKWWLIPNLKLSRWQRLLKNSVFFDVLGNSSKPMLVKPAQLELLDGDRRKLIAKGIFN